MEPGEGPIAELNQLVHCKYVGRLQATGEVFERAEDTGYRIGDSDTTPGACAWRIAVHELIDGHSSRCDDATYPPA